jgi:hypothetical protein
VNYGVGNGHALENNPLIIKDMDSAGAVTIELRTFYDLGNWDIIYDNNVGQKI